MDTTASEIVFDEKGVCNFCKECESYLNKTIFRSIDIRTEELNVSIDNFHENINYQKVTTRNSFIELPDKIEFLLTNNKYLEIGKTNLNWGR